MVSAGTDGSTHENGRWKILNGRHPIVRTPAPLIFPAFKA